MVGRTPGSPPKPSQPRGKDGFEQDQPTVAVEPDFASSLPTVRETTLELQGGPDEDVPAEKPPSVVDESDFDHDRPTVARDVDDLVEASLAVSEFTNGGETVAIRGQAERPATPEVPAAEILESPGVYRMKRPPIADDITTPLPSPTPVVEKKVRLGLTKKT